MLGAVLALASAGFFGLNSATVRRGVIKATVLQGMAITVPLGVPLFVALALAMDGFKAMAAWEFGTWGWMTLAGVVHFVVGRYGNYRATQALGATLSAPIQQVSIVIALVLALGLLGETLNIVKLFGVALVMFGPMIVVRRRRSGAAAGRAKGFEPQYGPGMAWGAVCAFGYGISPVLIALGLGERGSFADSAAGVLVSYVAAALVVAVLVAVAGGRTYLAQLDRGSGFWFLISAVFVALSQLLRYLALVVAPVSVVVPIQRLSVVFRIVFNAIINRDHEVLDIYVILSILLAVVGAVALTVDTNTVLSALAIPADIASALARPLF